MRNLKLLLCCLAAMVVFSCFSGILAQENAEATEEKKPSPWIFSGDAGLNFAQTSLTNWAAGGENSISGNALVNLMLTYKENKHKWVTKLNTEYGLMYTKANSINKTVDKLAFNTQYGYALDNKESWFATFVGDFKTQYDKGYDAAGDRLKDSDTTPTYKSKFMAPGYLNLSVGVEYHKAGLLDVYYSPAVMRSTFVCDEYLSNMGMFGVEKGSRYLIQAGMQLNTHLNWNITDRITLSSDLSLFTPYSKDFGKVVVDWDVLLVMKVTSWLNATVGTSLKYDDKIKTLDAATGQYTRGAKVQFKEMITVGLAYMFSTEKKK